MMRNFRICYFLLVSGAFVSLGCRSEDTVSQAKITPLTTPINVRVRQRSTTPVPSSKDQLLLTVDDVTRDQVSTSLSTNSGLVVMPVRSLSTLHEALFRYADTDYSIRLASLHNEIVGEDFATFIISQPSDTILSEAEKIEQLIRLIGSLKGASFIRNGEPYTAEDAANHLRAKWNNSGSNSSDVTTAKQFIDQFASRSSQSGEAYQIKFENGETVLAGDFLLGELVKIESQKSVH